jgi:hypothetical protein
MRIVPLFALAVIGLTVSACQNLPETIAIQHQYVGADMTPYGRNPTASAVGNVTYGLADQPQGRCAVVKYDPYGRPYCDAVKYLR